MAKNIGIYTIVKHAKSVAWSCIDNEAILLNLHNGMYYTLNEVGCESWKLMDETRSLKQIGKALCEIYDAGEQQVERDLLLLAEELQQEKLITIKKKSTEEKTGQ